MIYISGSGVYYAGGGGGSSTQQGAVRGVGGAGGGGAGASPYNANGVSGTANTGGGGGGTHMGTGGTGGSGIVIVRYLTTTIPSTLWIKPASTNAWEFVAFDGSTYYKNGVVGTPTFYPLNGYKIGVNPAGAYFKGVIDEVRFWNRSLSADQIRQLYLSNLNKQDTEHWAFYANESDLVISTYTYSASAQDRFGGTNSTETRTLIIRGPCTPNLVNTSFSAWEDIACVVGQMNQSRFLTQYDDNACDTVNNQTFYQYQLVGPLLANTTFTSWYDTSACFANDTKNQERNATQYDAYGCAANTTAYEYQAASCDYCTPSLSNTSFGSWSNVGCSGNQMNQSRYLTQYDINRCYDQTGLGSDSAPNVTFYDYQLVGPSLAMTSFGEWANATACLPGDYYTQERSATQYDEYGCGANTTIYDYRNLSCQYVTNTTFIAPVDSGMDVNYTFEGSVTGAIENGTISSNAQNLTVSYAGAKKVQVTALFGTQTVNLSSLIVRSSETKTVASFSGTSGVSLTHALFVPDALHAGVYVCPSALDLPQVDPSCPGVVAFNYAEASAGTSKMVAGANVRVSIEGSDYKIAGLTGTGVAEGTLTNLTVWDDAEVGMPYAGLSRVAGQMVVFYANFTNASQMPSNATSGACVIDFADPAYDGYAAMIWDAGLKLHTFTTSFASAGNYAWKVNCTGNGDNLEALDNIIIGSSTPSTDVPEFGTWALLVALGLVAGGIVSMRGRGSVGMRGKGSVRRKK